MKDFKIDLEVDISYDSVAPKGFDFESHSSKTVISYDMEIEEKKWGIASIYAVVPYQEILMKIEVLSQDESVEDPEEFLVKIKLKDVTVESHKTFNLGNSLIPEKIEITITEIQLEGGDYVASATGNLKF